MAELTAPKIDYYIDILKRGFVIGEEMKPYVDELFNELHKIAPCGNDNRRELWLFAERGKIEDYGDYEEMYEFEEVDSREEYEELWANLYPDEKCWYHFVSVEHGDFRAVFLKHKPMFEENHPAKNSYDSFDISPFIKWLTESVENCVKQLENGTYNETVRRELPPKDRIGTIVRRKYWEIFPEYKETYFSDISKDDIDEFLHIIETRGAATTEKIPDMTAEMFYDYCKLGYEANQYKGIDKLTAKELYLMHADGRDEGLRDIDGNSPTAFSEWYESSLKGIGHPWEVCRGGNSTHISLYVRKNGNEYSLKLAGSSYGRSVETIKFFLALVRNNIPVSLYEAEELAARVRADDKIGIVPDGVMPFYCSSYFPDDENISDYMNIELYEDKEQWKKVIENVIWQEIEEQRLL